MNDRNLDQLLTAWLELGPSSAPNRVADAVRLEARRTRQTAALSWWPTRRFPLMNNTAKFGLAAAVVVVAALLGYSYLVAPNVGGPSLGDPTPTPSPTAAPQRLGNVPLDPGPVEATGFGDSGSVTLRFTVPDGWIGFSGVGVLPSTGTEGPDGMGIGLGEVNSGLFADPCQWRTADEVPVGPTVDDLVNAFTEQTAYEASAPVDVSLGGYTGKRVNLQLPSDIAACDNGEFYPWVGSIYAQGPDNRWDVWILDVEGERIVVFATHFPGTSEEDLAEQQAIIDSIVIER